MPIATKEKRGKLSVGAQVAVDFPRQGERITGASYTFRVSAPENARSVDVAVDQGDWRPCRRSAGFWWCDWSGYDHGEHEVVARLIMSEGRVVSAQPHEFFVQLVKRTA